MGLFLGVDGGQTSTVALIGDHTGRVLGFGIGGPCNHVEGTEGRAKFLRAMKESVGSAGKQAGLSAQELIFDGACLGFSGGAADKEAYSREFIQSSAFLITHDAQIALTGATGGSPGVIVIAGTGSIAFGKNEDGRLARAGGWGFIFGDEGGAFDIVRQALRAALAVEEGWGAKTTLGGILLRRTGHSTANQLLHSWYNGFHREAVAELAPLVDGAADEGDAVAQQILNQAGQRLASLAGHVHGILFSIAETVPVAYIGGVFSSSFLTRSFQESLEGSMNCTAIPPLLPPAAGALLEALRLAGNPSSLSCVPPGIKK